MRNEKTKSFNTFKVKKNFIARKKDKHFPAGAQEIIAYDQNLPTKLDKKSNQMYNTLYNIKLMLYLEFIIQGKIEIIQKHSEYKLMHKKVNLIRGG